MKYIHTPLLIAICACSMVAILLTSCQKDEVKEPGIAVALETECKQDNFTSASVFIFDKEGILRHEQYFDNFYTLASTAFPMSVDKYTVCVVSNVKPDYDAEAIVGKTTLQDLRIAQAKPNPVHAHFGLSGIGVEPLDLSLATIQLYRMLSELQLTVTEVPVDVVNIDATVENAASAMLPAAKKLSVDKTPVPFGKGDVQNGHVAYDMIRLMPTADAQDYSLIRLEVLKSDNSTEMAFVEAPVMKNGGVYKLVVPYNQLRPGEIYILSEINGWQDLTPVDGEILNPNF